MRQQNRAHPKDSESSSRRARTTPEASSPGRSSSIELTAADFVKKAGEKGVLQNELLKNLSMDNRKGSKLVSKLESQGLVKKTRELYGGKWTYRLTSPKNKTVEFRWEDMDCPCLFCNDSGRCSLGNIVSPSSCSFLSGWLKSYLAQPEPSDQAGS